MAGIYVLSEIPKGGKKLGKASTSKGENVSDSPQNAAGFAAMMSGFTNSKIAPKGQNSKGGKELEEKQSAGNPEANVQIANDQTNVPGYGAYALINLIQPILESSLPAGKDANSGNDVSQGTEGLTTANDALLKLISLISDEVSAQSGMTTPKPEGDNPAITELDQYRQVIAKLLEALSGKITDSGLKENLSGLESTKIKDFSQEMAKIVQSWTTVSEGVVKDGQPNLFLNKALNSLRALFGDNPTNSPGVGLGNPVNVKAAPLLSEIGRIDPEVKGSSELHVQPKSEVIGAQGNKLQTVNDDTLLSAQASGDKDLKIPVSNVSIGVASNLLATNVVDGKTIAVPVWEQVSTALREQVMNSHQALKALDIQLHPAELGNIQIAMRWENGQVHLVVSASEAATGQLLQNQFSDLRQNLTNHGVNCGLLQMGQGGERQHNPRQDQGHRTFNQTTDLNEGEDQNAISNFFTLGQDGLNRINVTA